MAASTGDAVDQLISTGEIDYGRNLNSALWGGSGATIGKYLKGVSGAVSTAARGPSSGSARGSRSTSSSSVRTTSSSASKVSSGSARVQAKATPPKVNVKSINNYGEN